MARIRYLKPDFFKDEDLATLPFEVRLFFAGLWNFADKAGRLEDRPLRLKVDIFPYDKVDIDKCLSLLTKPKNGSQKPFIQRYEVNGERFIQIINWDKHQKPHHTEVNSHIPKPPPLTTPIKIMEKGMGMEKQHEASTELSNGDITVKEPLITHPPHVSITNDDLKNLIETYGIGLVREYISRLNDYAAQKPKKFKEYASHCATIRNWMRRDAIKKLPPKPKGQPKEELRHDPAVAALIHNTTLELTKKAMR